MKVRTLAGMKYAVTAPEGAVVQRGDKVLCDVAPGKQAVFVATGGETLVSEGARVTPARGLVVLRDMQQGWFYAELYRGLTDLLGEDNVQLSFDNDTQVLSVAFALDATQTQIESAKQLIDRVIPQNLDKHFEWMGGMPFDYTPVEYLERSVDIGSWINTGLLIENLNSKIKYTALSSSGGGGNGSVVFGIEIPWGIFYGAGIMGNSHGIGFLIRTPYSNSVNYTDMPTGTTVEGEINFSKSYACIRTDGYEERRVEIENKTQGVTLIAGLFARQGGGIPAHARVHWLQCDYMGEPAANYIPALDPTGTPCMYDTVTRTPFYNSGTGDFLYPEAETVATTYSLRNRMYAQMTPHGIRRLYHVPKGYNGTKEEYAAENGFKVLVETQQPEEGYWAPQWTETEDAIVLEWVETEAPAEEELLTETE